MESKIDRAAGVSVQEVRQKGLATNISISWVSNPDAHEVAAMDTDDDGKTTVEIPRRVIAKAMSMILRHEMKKSMGLVIEHVLEEVFGGPWVMEGSNDGETWVHVCKIDTLPPGCEPFVQLDNDDPTPPYRFIRYVDSEWVRP